MIRTGISGWTYRPWRGVFYPPGLPQRRELAYAASRLGSIEINGTFYSLQRPSSFARWRAETPDDFVFAVKGGRFITHLRRLREPRTPLANFFASGVLALGPQLGPLLWQLPPDLAFDPDLLRSFLDELPRSHGDALRLAHDHDDRLAGDRLHLTTDEPDRPLRHALEVRHESFRSPELLALLRAYDVALVVADTAGRWPQIEELTAGFAYIRLHGADELYVSGYTDEGLDRWAAKVAAWAEQVDDVYVYFDNDVKVRAPFDAMALAERLTWPSG